MLADLPGCGFAAMPMADKLRWQQVMANYLVSRENLTEWCCCATRLGLTELGRDPARRDSPTRPRGLKFLIVLTKADKLTRVEASKALSIARLQPVVEKLMLFSATKTYPASTAWPSSCGIGPTLIPSLRPPDDMPAPAALIETYLQPLPHAIT